MSRVLCVGLSPWMFHAIKIQRQQQHLVKVPNVFVPRKLEFIAWLSH